MRCAGLKLDDVRNEWHPDVQTALSRLSPEELSNRNKRLKRAMDLSLKHSELNKEAQAAVEPLVGYLPLERAREERLERFARPLFLVALWLCRSLSPLLPLVNVVDVGASQSCESSMLSNGNEETNFRESPSLLHSGNACSTSGASKGVNRSAESRQGWATVAVARKPWIPCGLPSCRMLFPTCVCLGRLHDQSVCFLCWDAMALVC